MVLMQVLHHYIAQQEEKVAADQKHEEEETVIGLLSDTHGVLDEGVARAHRVEREAERGVALLQERHQPIEREVVLNVPVAAGARLLLTARHGRHRRDHDPEAVSPRAHPLGPEAS